MKVIEADVLGMCFGVRDALKALAKVEKPSEATIHGELVHNQEVLYQLERRGFAQVDEGDRRAIPGTPVVVVTAHGISDRERRRLADAGKVLVDTTCPLVERAHRAALGLQSQGYFVVVIGKKGHVEVRGIVEDLDRWAVVERVEEIRDFEADRVGVVCQTTTPEPRARELLAAIESRNPRSEVRFVDTICLPTKDHQRAVERLLRRVSAVVVVGGRNSNNTKALVERCRQAGATAWHVEAAADLDPAWFDGIGEVGLTAGTSTLDGTIAEVRRALMAIEAGAEVIRA
ncbi:MAG: 4-hydroxy-3-methylbut-2-enyl diphosphate reductase [Isosphaeraceae bacterium]